LAGAKRQPDEPGDITRLEAEIAAAEKELHELKEA
jgi:hypothetical protein